MNETDVDNNIGASLERFIEKGGKTPIYYACDMIVPDPEPVVVIRKNGEDSQ